MIEALGHDVLEADGDIRPDHLKPRLPGDNFCQRKSLTYLIIF